jgi:hypothetical protein
MREVAAFAQAFLLGPSSALSVHPLLGASAIGELLSRSRYRGRNPNRPRDQVGHRGDRPDQANRDHDGDSHHPSVHLHPLYVALSLPIGVRIFFRRPDVR